MKGTLRAKEVSATRFRASRLMWHFEEKEETTEKVGEGRGGGGGGGVKTEALQSVHDITFPFNSCQGPSAVISLIKCSRCCEQSA